MSQAYWVTWIKFKLSHSDFNMRVFENLHHFPLKTVEPRKLPVMTICRISSNCSNGATHCDRSSSPWLWRRRPAASRTCPRCGHQSRPTRCLKDTQHCGSMCPRGMGSSQVSSPLLPMNFKFTESSMDVGELTWGWVFRKSYGIKDFQLVLF